MAERQSHQQYFPHIDGLRALAIIPVVLYHLLPSFCPGGFAGVDVFFVISGYLITGGIIADLKNGQFSIANFYLRRIKRILPAYFAIIAFVLIVCPSVYSFLQYSSICKTAIYSAFYSANIYFATIISYFDVDARNNPLLHLWSLGVEEQFYLVVPVFIWILWIVRSKYILHTLLFLFLLSFISNVWSISNGHSQFAFFMLPSRAWELVAGAIVSQIDALRFRRPTWSFLLSWFGVALVLLPYVLYSDQTPFPGMAATPPILGAALMILYGARGGLNELLSSKTAVWVGKVSYSLYLWHWPIFVLLGSSNSLKRGAAGLIATILASFLSYRFIELPVRRCKAFKKPHAFTMLIAGSLIITIVCLSVLVQKAKTGELPSSWEGKETWVIAELSRDNSRSSCRIEDLNAENSRFLIKIGKTNSPPCFALWGDSQSLAMMPGVDLVASEYGKSGYYINLKHSLTLNCDIGAYPFNPREDREPVIRWLESRHDITDIFLVNYWFKHLRFSADIEETVKICERLHKSGKHVFFFANVPWANERALRRLSWGLRVNSSLSATSVADYTSQAGRQNRLIQELVKRHIATVLPIDKAFLKGVAYYSTTDTNSFYSDSTHLNQTGGVRAMEFVAPMIWSSLPN
jgi:peptidoglycan/LPS O-acetylase OafA/YrhL